MVSAHGDLHDVTGIVVRRVLYYYIIERNGELSVRILNKASKNDLRVVKILKVPPTLTRKMKITLYDSSIAGGLDDNRVDDNRGRLDAIAGEENFEEDA